MKKILYFDVETTGLDPIKNDIIQIALIITIDGKIMEEHEFKCQPFSYENICDEALEVHGMRIEEIKTFPKPEVIYKEIMSIFGKHIDKFDKADKMYPAGYNVRFDLNFISSFFVKNFDSYWGSWCNWKTIDPLPILYIMDYRGLISLPDYKLETVCNHFGIELKAHDALSDIRATRELIKKVSGYLK